MADAATLECKRHSNMRGKRRNFLSGNSFRVGALWIGLALAGPAGRNSSNAVASVAAATSSLSAAAVIPPSKTRSEIPVHDSDVGKEEGKSTILAHRTARHDARGLMRLQDVVRRRLRHSLCALPFLAQKAGVKGDIVYKNTARKIRHQPGTRFTLRFPDANIADEIWQRMKIGDEIPFNHDCVGMTKPSDLFPTTIGAPGDRKAGGDKWDGVPVMGDYSLDKYCWPNSELSGAKTREGWRVLRYRHCVGLGEECYERVRQAVLNWEFSTGDKDFGGTKKGFATKGNKRRKAIGIIRARDRTSLDAKVTTRAQSISLGLGRRRMVTYTECRYGIDIRPGLRVGLPTFYAVNPVTSVYDVVDERCSNGDMFTSTAYATVGDHLLAGEERVTAILRHSEGKVHVEILSVSRSAPTLAGRLVWPFIGKMQSGFFEAELRHLLEVGRRCTYKR